MICGIAVFALWAGILANAFAGEVRRREFLRTWDMLTHVPLFRDLGAETIADISRVLKSREVSAGNTILPPRRPGRLHVFHRVGRNRGAHPPTLPWCSARASFSAKWRWSPGRRDRQRRWRPNRRNCWFSTSRISARSSPGVRKLAQCRPRGSRPPNGSTKNRLTRSTMQMNDIPFGTTDWSTVEPTEHTGETGTATWRTRNFGGIRVRMVEYSPGYLADHWCTKGHILLCLEGRTPHRTGRWTDLHAHPRNQLSGGRRGRTASLQHGVRRNAVHRRLTRVRFSGGGATQ